MARGEAGTTRLHCEALLFDLDGVLVDSTACVEQSWRSWAARHGVDAEALLRLAHGRWAAETIRLVAPQLDAEAEVAALVEHESRATAGVVPVPGARELLASLPPDRWAIVTSGARPVAEHRLRVVGLPVPPVMICGGDMARGKPAPDGYLAAAARLGVAPAACVVVEDAPAGVEAARAGGMRVVALTTTHAADALRQATVVASALDALAVRADGDGVGLRLAIRPSGG